MPATEAQKKAAYEAMLKLPGVTPEQAAARTGYTPAGAAASPASPKPAPKPEAVGGAQIDNLEGAEPKAAPRRPKARSAAARQQRSVPAGFVPMQTDEREWRSRGESYPEPGSMDRTPKMLETPGQFSRTGQVIGIHPDGTVLIQKADGGTSRIHISQLSGQDAAHVLSSAPQGMAGRISFGDPAEYEAAKQERDRYMWEEKTGFLGDGRDLADTDAKLAEFRRQRRAGMRPGTNTEQQYEMFGPGGDDAAARAESQAAIDAQVAAGQRRDKAVRQSIDRDKAKYGPGKGITRYDEEGNVIETPELTRAQSLARTERRNAEERTRQDPSHVNAMVARLARTAGISREEAMQIYRDGEKKSPGAGAEQLRLKAGSARDRKLADQEERLLNQRLFPGDRTAANAFTALSPDEQQVALLKRFGIDSPTPAAERMARDEMRARRDVAATGADAQRDVATTTAGAGVRQAEINAEKEKSMQTAAIAGEYGLEAQKAADRVKELDMQLQAQERIAERADKTKQKEIEANIEALREERRKAQEERDRAREEHEMKKEQHGERMNAADKEKEAGQESDAMGRVERVANAYQHMNLPSNAEQKARLMLGLQEVFVKGRDPESVPEVDKYLFDGVYKTAYDGLFDNEFDAEEVQQADEMLRRLGVPNPMRYIDRVRRSPRGPVIDPAGGAGERQAF